MNSDELNLVTLSAAFADEDKAREFFEAQRWPDGNVVCPHCKCGDAYKLTPKAGSKRPVRPGVYKCRKCRKQFTVRIGSDLEESKLPLRKWLMAMHLMTSSKKGVSSRQLERMLDVQPKTAWFLSMRIREAMKDNPYMKVLRGTIEADETYVGGRPRFGGKPGRPNPETDSKTPVVVLVERDGRAYSTPVDRVTTERLKQEFDQMVDAEVSELMTDELSTYTKIGRKFRRHDVITHKTKRYAEVRDGRVVSTNTAESFFAIMKRSHYGIHHHMSRRHLHRYCVERTFMWDHRKKTDGARMVEAIKGSVGKRLVYRDPT